MTTAFVLSGGGNLGAVQAGQLRALVNAGIAVASFSEEHENLHQSYLRSVQRADSGTAPQ